MTEPPPRRPDAMHRRLAEIAADIEKSERIAKSVGQSHSGRIAGPPKEKSRA